MPFKKILSENGLYVLLIPAFFVLHGYVQNFGLIRFSDCLLLLPIYLIASIVLYLAVWLFYRTHLKSCLLVSWLFSFYLFFGSLDDFLKTHLFLLSRYMIIIPLFILSVIWLSIYLKKTMRSLFKITFFINILLLIYLVVDTAGIGLKLLNPNADKLSIYGADSITGYTLCADCENPDIYFLLFDEYSSSNSLQQTFHYNNSRLDSFLLQKGFSLQANSQSNYNFTPFSMASILNMNYISGIKNIHACTIQDYANCNNLIRNNAVIRFLSSRRYDIINYSIFDLAGNPSLIVSSLLPVKTRLITEQTLFNRMIHDIGWNLYIGKFEISWLSKNLIYENLTNNNKILYLVKRETSMHSQHPRFVYAHFEMPHPPFYYNKNEAMRDKKELISEQQGDHMESYLGYIPYTNNKIRELIDTIQKNTNHAAVIIIMGDHGYRIETGTASHSHHFKNLNAVYFPDKAYHLLTDSISGVNQFRAILNTLFKQNFPLLKDSSIFLTDQ